MKKASFEVDVEGGNVDVEGGNVAPHVGRQVKNNFVFEYLWQLYALLYKNAVLFKRNYVSSIVKVFAPAVCVLLFGVVLKANELSSLVENPDPFVTYGGEFGLQPCSVFDNQGGRFGYGMPQTNMECITIAFAPKGDPYVESVVARLLANNPELAASDFEGFNAADDIRLFANDPDATKSVNMGLVFPKASEAYRDVSATQPGQDIFLGGLDVQNAGSSVSSVGYQLMFNLTVAGSKFYANAGQDKLAEATGGTGGYTTKTDYVLQVQRAVNEAVLQVHSGNPAAKLEMSLKQFPYLEREQTDDDARENFGAPLIERFASVFYLLGIMMIFVICLKEVVQEKEDKIIDALRMMGLYESCYWLSWAIYYAATSSLSAIMMVVFGKLMDIRMFVYTDTLWLFSVYFFLLMAAVSLAFFLSTLMPTSRIASMVSFMFVAASIILQFFVAIALLDPYTVLYSPHSFSLPAKATVIGLFPSSVYSKLEISMNLYTTASILRNETTGDVTTVQGQYEMSDAHSGLYQVVKPEIFNEIAQSGLVQEGKDTSQALFEAARSLLASSIPGSGITMSSSVREVVDALALQCQKPIGGGGNSLLRICHTDQAQNDYDNVMGSPSCSPFWSNPESAAEYTSYGGCYDYPNCPRPAYTNWTEGTCSSELSSNHFYAFDEDTGHCKCSYVLESDSDSLGALVLITFVWLLLAWYVGQVVTFGHGKAEPVWFPLNPAYWIPATSKRVSSGASPKPQNTGKETDDDVLKENADVTGGARDDWRDWPVVIRNLVKVFGGGPFGGNKFYAVNGLNVAFRNGECFALLGHNGAGKTTAINCLSGMTAVSGGDCIMYGKSVVTSMASIRHDIGVCPQHDILWGSLTAREHLRFYGHFQGMSRQQISRQGEHLLKQVHLDKLTRKAGQYSGGMKRRLSMSIAALGNKRIIFLDEPTTGLDPQNQRHVWDMINELKRDRVIILTTHLMDEADALGDRIGIMSKGRLVALGNPLHLKSKFGGNYKVSIGPRDKDARTSIHKEVVAKVPEITSEQDPLKGNGSMVYTVAPESFQKAPALFRAIDAMAGAGVVKDWGLAQTSLEDVFVMLDENKKKKTTPVIADAVPAGGKQDDSAPAALTVAEVADNEDNEGHIDFEAGGEFAPSSRLQIRALFRKSMALQRQQKCTNFCQVLIPLVLLGLMVAIKIIEDGGGERNENYGYYGPNTELTLDQKLSQCVDCVLSRKFSSEYNSLDASAKAQLDQWESWSTGSDRSFDSFRDTVTNYTAEEAFVTIPAQLQCSGPCSDIKAETAPANYDSLSSFWPTSEWSDSSSYDRSTLSTGRLWVAATDQTIQAVIENSLWTCDQVGGISLESSENLQVEQVFTCPSSGYSSNSYNSRYGTIGLGETPLPLPGGTGLCSVSPSSSVNKTSLASKFDELIKPGANQFFRAIPASLSFRQFSSDSSINARAIFAGVSMCSQTSQAKVNQLLVGSQRQALNKEGDFESEKESSFRAMDTLVKHFPDGALIFDELDVGLGKVAFTYQTYYTDIDTCYNTLYYPYARVYVPYSPNSDGGGSPPARYCSSLSPGATKMGGHFGTVESSSYVLNSVTTAMLRSVTADSNSPLQGAVDPVLTVELSSLEAEQTDYVSRSFDISFAALLVPLATTFLLPVFVFHVVHEKEHKLRASMSMMGLQMGNYWLVQYMFDFAMASVVFVLIYIVSLAFGLEEISNHQFGFVLLTLLIWANALIGFAFLLSVFFSRTRNANIFLYLFVFLACLASSVVNPLVFDPQPYLPAPVWWIWLPPFAYYRQIHLYTKRTYYWEDVSGEDELVQLWGVLFLQAVFCFAAAFYLDQVLPKQFGVRRSPLFPIEDLIALCRGRKASSIGVNVNDDDDDEAEAEVGAAAGPGEDLDVATERHVVLSGQVDDQPIVIKKIEKHFGSFTAVAGVSMHMTKGCTALLGPNGAGKSTICSMLTGLYGPSGGKAFIGGKSISTQMKEIYSIIGVCPQHDIYWPELTVKDHLLLCARLKGASPAAEQTVVARTLAAVKLSGHGHKKARQLSGGQRRRMSIAMSFIGHPTVVFLDEPTTGVDPVTRSYIHELVEREQKNRCIVLTTHLMSEAEKLCKRIGIMAHGTLKTIGTADELKRKYNEGFKLIIVAHDHDAADAFIQSKVSGAKLESQVNNRYVYRIDKEAKVGVSEVFELLHSKGKANGISDWQLSATTLEDVFIAIASESEAEFGTA